jgi:hypothetical protein
MKKSIRFLALGAAVTLLSLSAFASGTQAQDCTPENKTAWYNTFLENYKGDQAKAYEVAKKYLACPVDAADSNDVAQAAYMKDKFVVPYEKLHEKAEHKAQLKDYVYNKKDYAKAFEVGKLVLADEPDYFSAYLDLAYAGFAAFNAGNKSFANDATAYAKKSIEIIESGKTPSDWKPATTKEDTLAKLNYWIAAFKQDTSPAEAITYWIKAATFDTFKKSVEPYYYLGLSYEKGNQKQFDDYTKLYKDKPDAPESKLAIENLNQVVDRVIDAFARSVALAGGDAQYKDLKADAMGRLTDWYKFRHNDSDAGLNDLIAGILSKPLPPVPTPITSLPPTPPATPATTGGSAAKNTTGTATPAKTPAKPKRAHAGN